MPSTINVTNSNPTISVTTGPAPSISVVSSAVSISLTQAAITSPIGGIGLPTDGTWADGLATIVATNTVADAVAAVSEAALAIIQDGYQFHGIRPASDVTYDLGTSALRWRKLYVGPGSLHISSLASETTTARDYSWGIVTAAGATQGYASFSEAGTPSPLLTISPSGAVQIASTLGVTGASTLAALSATGLTVTGSTTLASLSATSASFSGTLGVTGTSTLAGVQASSLTVTGSSTLASLAATSASVSGAFGVTGASTLAALSATTGSFSSTLSVTGSSTLAAVSATNATFSGTLGVTGASTLAAVSATTGTFSGNINAANYCNVGLGANDSTNYTSGTYWETDCLIGEQGAFGGGTAAGLNWGFGLYTPGGSPANVGQYVNADVDQHVGVGWVQSTALNEKGYLSYGNASSNPFYLAVYPNSPTMTFTMIFCSPKNLSNATDRYKVWYGPFVTSGSGTGVTNGWSLRYSDNVNSGNWQVVETVSGVDTVLASSSTAALANTWYHLVFTIAAKKVTCVLTPSGGSPTTLVNAVTSTQLNAGSPMPVCLATIQIQRTAFNSGNLGSLIDYASFYTTGTTRT